MFEKGMDERMILYRGKAMVLGGIVFAILLLVKDTLVDFSIISFPRVGTIADLLIMVIGIFTMIVYLIDNKALKDDYVLNAWYNFAVLSIFSMLWLLPSILAGKQLMIGNQLTMMFLKLIQVVIFTVFTFYMYLQSKKLKKELRN